MSIRESELQLKLFYANLDNTSYYKIALNFWGMCILLMGAERLAQPDMSNTVRTWMNVTRIDNSMLHTLEPVDSLPQELATFTRQNWPDYLPLTCQVMNNLSLGNIVSVCFKLDNINTLNTECFICQDAPSMLCTVLNSLSQLSIGVSLWFCVLLFYNMSRLYFWKRQLKHERLAHKQL